MDQYLLLNNIDFHRLPILIDHFCRYQFLFDKCLLNTFSLKYMFCTVCYILLAKTMIIIRFIRKNNIPRLKTCNGNNSPVEKDSSVTMDSGAKLDAVGGGGT